MIKIILLAILLFVVGLNYACVKLAKSNPDIISGFKMSDEPKQRAIDEAWLNKMFRYMNIANVLTFAGGLIGIIFDLQILFIISLVLPLCLALLIGYIQRKGGKSNKTTIIAILSVIILICLPVVYFYATDLDITISDEKIEIHGLYGEDIPLQEIKETSLCQSLPEISIKTNGFALGNTRLGHFRTSKGENIMLFTHSDSSFIRIVRANGTAYYLSFKDKKATEQLLTELQNKTKQ